METKAQREHIWLQQLLGDWTLTGECDMGPAQPASQTTGTEHVRGLGELWVVCEGQGEMPGNAGTGNMLMTLGYDTDKKKFVGSWAGSMMPGMFFYDGQLDAARKVLTLDTEGPSFTGDGTTAKYQDVITIKSKDERTLHSQTLQPDGGWKRFMTATYRRVK
ncbi:DUF1579 domain-containing protein [Polaromonas eurypsychrophila]|uniref:DUF1579 domain-containing protein n=1 Tax=Polaromonas eurypsychrophila TaxID=1614635 RepID=A0A916S9G8_9BURK|nr:DUF1579 domain-containing protein [Polaromonas eurypsychrophila]GGA89975.1 hypothetical protein GCM10011496_08520 [Polaromonas eurypsychrophila]